MINHLLNEINSFIKKNYITYNLTLKFSQIKFLDKIFNLVDVIKCNYEKDFVSLKVRGKPIIIKKIISDIKKSLKHDINGTPI